MKLRNKLNISYLVAYVIIFSVIVGAIGIYTTNIVKNNIFSYLHSSNRARAEHVRTFISDQETTGIILAAASVYRDLLKEPETSSQYPVIKAKIDKRLARTMQADSLIYETFILDANGKVVASSDKSFEGQDRSSDTYFTEAKDKVFFKDVYLSDVINKLTYAIAVPVKDDDGTFLGVSVLRYLPKDLDSIVQNENGLGKTEENFLINKDKFFLTPSLFLGPDVILKQKVDTKNANDCFNPSEIAYVTKNGYGGLQQATNRSQIEEIRDYRNVDVVATHAYIPETGWCLITKIDRTDALSFRTTFFIIFLLIFVIAALVYFLLGFFITERIAKSLAALVTGAQKIQQGDYSYKTNIRTDDEIGDFSRTFDKMTKIVQESRADIERKVDEQTKDISSKVKLIEKQQAATLNILEDVEKEKSKSEGLAKDLEKFKLAVDYASDHIIITDAEGTTLYVNKAAEKITGFSGREILGKKAGSKQLWGGRMSQDFYKKMWSTIKIDKKIFSGIINNKRKNGEIYQAMASISPILDRAGNVQFFVGIERDVTKQQQREEALSKLAAIIENSDDAIISLDLKGNIDQWNIGAEKLYGYSAEEIMGKSIKTFVPKEDQPLIDKNLAKIARGESILHFETARIHKNGGRLDLSVSWSPVKDGAGKITGVSIIARDYSREKAIDKAKTEFVSLASHQLRTPLSAINWYAEMLLNGDAGKINKEQKDYLEEIYRGNQRMVDLINALLNVSRLELGTFIVEPVPTDIVALCRDVVKEMNVKILENKLQVKETYDKTLKRIEVDPKLLRIVFQNLISNAVKYTPPKGKVDISIAKQGKNFLITVADTGYGIPLKDQSRIFEKLFRADNIRVKDVEGTGLGLYLVKSIVEQSQGKVWFESKENKGTTFYVTLPLAGMVKKAGTKSLS